MHGYQSFGKSFYHQLDYLSKDFEVFAPDLKGFGQNADMLYPYSLDEYILEVFINGGEDVYTVLL